MMFKPTYLYIKIHNKTGLKYFGKTIKKDPHKYKGSGKYWVNHIKKYGNDVTTIIYGFYIDKEKCINDAIEFSKNNNIVNSKEWANLIEEMLEGGDTSNTEGYKKSLLKIKEHRKKNKWWNNGMHQTFSELPPDNSYIRGRLKFNNIGAQIGSTIQKEKKWVNNGNHEMMIHKNDTAPEGYTSGRLLNKAFAGKQGRHTKGTYWWNNGTISKMSACSPGKEWIKGRIKSQP